MRLRPRQAPLRPDGVDDRLLRAEDLRPVTVAVTGSPSGWDTLQWAAAEAAARGCGLRVVHGYGMQPADDLLGMVSTAEWGAAAVESAEETVQQAVQRARAVSPTLPVSTHVGAGSTRACTLREGHDAALTVLDRDSFLRRSGRPSPTRALARRHDAVAVVTLGRPGTWGPSHGRVVVSVDGCEDPLVVLGAAFRAAERRGAGLSVVRSHAVASPRSRVEGYVDRSRVTSTVERALRRCHAAFPLVDVEQRVLDCDLEAVLSSESRGAALVVLGSPVRTVLQQLLVGPTERRLVTAVRAPVVLVPGPPRPRARDSR